MIFYVFKVGLSDKESFALLSQGSKVGNASFQFIWQESQKFVDFCCSLGDGHLDNQTQYTTLHSLYSILSADTGKSTVAARWPNGEPLKPDSIISLHHSIFNNDEQFQCVFHNMLKAIDCAWTIMGKESHSHQVHNEIVPLCKSCIMVICRRGEAGLVLIHILAELSHSSQVQNSPLLRDFVVELLSAFFFTHRRWSAVLQVWSNNPSSYDKLEPVLRTIFQIDTHLSNLYRGSHPHRPFYESTFVQHLLSVSMMFIPGAGIDHHDSRVELVSHVVRLAISLHPQTVARALLQHLRRRNSDTEVLQQVMSRVYRFLHHSLTFVVEVLGLCLHVDEMVVMVGGSPLVDAVVPQVRCAVARFFTRFPPHRVDKDDQTQGTRTRCLILGLYLRAAPTLLQELAWDLLSMASSFVPRCESSKEVLLDYHRALHLTLLAVSEEELQQHCGSQLTSVVMQFVQLHLNSSLESTRLLGMVTGEFLTDKVRLAPSLPDSTNLPSLRFDYEKTNPLLKDLLNWRTASFEELLREFSAKGQEGEIDALDELQLLQLDNVQEECVNENSSKEGTPSAGGTLDSDDEFEVLDLSADLPLQACRRPKYVAECLEGLWLTKPEEADIYRSCLESLVPLMLSQKDSARYLSEDLCQVLLNTSPVAHMENFESTRSSALTTLVVLEPKRVSRYLSSQFLTPHSSIGLNLLLLEVLQRGCLQLTGLAPSDALVAVLSSPHKPDTATNSSVQLAEKTRYFFQHSRNSAPPTQYRPSQFHAIAYDLTCRLLANYETAVKELRPQTADGSIILQLVLTTNTFLVGVGGNATMFPKLASELVHFWKELRDSCALMDAGIEHALCHAFATCLLMVPEHLFLAGDILSASLDWVPWLHIVKESALSESAEVRQLAEFCLSRVQMMASRSLTFTDLA